MKIAILTDDLKFSVRCGPNERFYQCARPCEAKTCSYFINRPPCPALAPGSQCTGVSKCDCIEKYAKNTPNGHCMPEDDCLSQLIGVVDYDLNTPLARVNIPTSLDQPALAKLPDKFTIE